MYFLLQTRFPQPLILSLLGLLLLFSACESGPDIPAAEYKVHEFYDALKQDAKSITPNYETLQPFYPDIKLLLGHYKSDKMEILESSPIGNDVSVKVKSEWTSGTGKKQENEIEFILTKKAGNWVIRDSYGFRQFEGDTYYDFAIKTGCLTKNQRYSDQETAEIRTKARDLHDRMYEEFKLEIKEGVTIKEWKWKKNLLGEVKVTGKVENTLSADLKGINYELVLKGKDGSAIRTDQASLVDLLKGKSVADFELKSPKAGKVDDASLKIVFDDYYIQNSFSEQDFKGNECGGL